MANFHDEVADCLTAVKGVDFYFDGIYVASQHFRHLATAIRNECIWVVGTRTLEAGTIAAYSPRQNCIYYDADARINLSDPFTVSTFVHEATHAVNDMFGRASIPRIDNEASAYIAQWQYLSFFSNIPEYYMNQGPFKRLASSLAVLKSLLALSDLIYGPGTRDLSGSEPLQELRDALGADPALYKEVVGQISDDNQGIPFLGIIKKIDNKMNTLTCTVNGKDYTSQITKNTSVTDPDGNQIVAGLRDKRFAVGTQVKIAREVAGSPYEASEVQLRK